MNNTDTPVRNMKQLVAAVERSEGKSFWTRIGVAFENRDGSWNLRFDFLPTDPETTIQLRNFDRRGDSEASPGSSDEQQAPTGAQQPADEPSAPRAAKRRNRR